MKDRDRPRDLEELTRAVDYDSEQQGSVVDHADDDGTGISTLHSFIGWWRR